MNRATKGRLLAGALVGTPLDGAPAATATSAGGAVTITGAAGGSTSGTGGAVTLTAGVGTAGNSAGGVGSPP